MIFLNEYRDQILFPELRNEYEDSMKYFIEEHKSKIEIISKNGDEISNILNTYTFENVCRDAFDNDSEYSEFEYIMIEKDILFKFINEFNVKIDNYFQDYLDNTQQFFTEEIFNYIDSDDFINWYVKIDEFDWSEVYDDEYYNNLVNIIDEEIFIYRALYINKDDDEHKKFDGVGEFWSYTESGAYPHGSSFDSRTSQLVILKAIINIKNIEWDNTFFKSVYILKDEEEIQTKRNITVKLIGYELVDANSKYRELKTKKDFNYLKTLRLFKSDEDIKNYIKKNANNLYNITLKKPININI